ncbi:MAG: pyruvate ferredoxin oxidoreductase subunit gamma [Patescibacteria group bacterium]
MIETRIHGRGGQGSVTLAELLAVAAFNSGKFAQAFPNFGVERRGAPVEAYVRFDDKFIRLRSQVYSPDYVIIQDPTLLTNENLLANLKPGAVVLLNSKDDASGLRLPPGVKVRTIYATELALKIIGKPIINTILLGAFAGLTKLIKMSAIERAIKERFEGEVAEKNILAAKKGFEVINSI